MDIPVAAYESIIESTDIEQVKVDALAAMTKLEGWCSPQKAATLIDLVFKTQAKTIVEIGVFGGKSLIPMAFALKAQGEGIVIGIDPWSAAESTVGEMDEANREWWAKIDHEAIYQGLKGSVKEFKLQKHVRLIKASSAEAEAIPSIDILHIDGNHSEVTSVFDVLKWVPMVRSGGLIIFDDLDWATTKKASSLLDEYADKLFDYKEGNVWGVWIKK